ncbi:MAG: hypothetical protein INH41_05360 [Myxococcaceae bacterium]|nr:hypothetical protein [Myxococcaceae bacterium]MCA3011812.1 hypothetical protein [Myxococcaceae bacterium]
MSRRPAPLERLQLSAAALQRLLDAGAWLELRRRARALIRAAAAAGIDSAYLWWCLTAACDELGDSLAALNAVCRAARLDPAHPAIVRAFADTCEHARARLVAAPSRSRRVPALYEALSRLGETDADCHLALARHLLARGDRAEARRLVDAVLTLAPTHVAACALERRLAPRPRATAPRFSPDRPLFGVPTTASS